MAALGAGQQLAIRQVRAEKVVEPGNTEGMAAGDADVHGVPGVLRHDHAASHNDADDRAAQPERWFDRIEQPQGGTESHGSAYDERQPEA